MELIFKINNVYKKSSELTYDDLSYLYKCFNEKNGLSSNNKGGLP